MKILIGLGNPKSKYQNNRHNIGQIFIDYLKTQNLNNGLILLKSSTFMNESGKFVQKILKKHQVNPENLYIIHDDLDIPLGKFKINFAQGPKLHNGIKSIEETIKTQNFWRIRIGVDARDKNNWIDGEVYVLQDFLKTEKDILINQVFPKIYQRLIINEKINS